MDSGRAFFAMDPDMAEFLAELQGAMPRHPSNIMPGSARLESAEKSFDNVMQGPARAASRPARRHPRWDGDDGIRVIVRDCSLIVEDDEGDDDNDGGSPKSLQADGNPGCEEPAPQFREGNNVVKYLDRPGSPHQHQISNLPPLDQQPGWQHTPEGSLSGRFRSIVLDSQPPLASPSSKWKHTPNSSAPIAGTAQAEPVVRSMSRGASPPLQALHRSPAKKGKSDRPSSNNAARESDLGQLQARGSKARDRQGRAQDLSSASPGDSVQQPEPPRQGTKRLTRGWSLEQQTNPPNAAQKVPRSIKGISHIRCNQPRGVVVPEVAAAVDDALGSPSVTGKPPRAEMSESNGCAIWLGPDPHQQCQVISADMDSAMAATRSKLPGTCGHSSPPFEENHHQAQMAPESEGARYRNPHLAAVSNDQLPSSSGNLVPRDFQAPTSAPLAAAVLPDSPTAVRSLLLECRWVPKQGAV